VYRKQRSTRELAVRTRGAFATRIASARGTEFAFIPALAGLPALYYYDQ
jgi:hypothetical protein